MKKLSAIMALFLLILTNFAYAATPSTGPSGENPGGIFATYFQNIVSNPCGSTSIVTSFSSANDANFLKTNCTNIGTLLGTFFTGYGTAGEREAVIGFNSTTGAPIFGTIGSQWQDRAGGIVYTDGNVGIGDTNPQSKLSILGSLNLADASGNSRTDIGFYIDTGLRIFNKDNSAIVLGTTNLERMRIDAAGNVGIGTIIPGYKLEVSGDIYANNGWVRTSGNKGWYNETYGGGWTMTDTTWIQTIGNKSIYTAGTIRADQGIYFSSDQKIRDGKNGWTYFTDASNVYSNGLAASKVWAQDSICLAGVCKTSWLPSSQWSDVSKGILYGSGSVGIGVEPSRFKLEVAGDIYADNGWVRTSGNKGWYNETYGGGWTMSDTTWIRTHGGKSIYTAGVVRADAGVYFANDQKIIDGNNGWTYLTDGAGNYSNGLAAKNISAQTAFCLAGECKTSWPISSKWTDSQNGIIYSSGNVGIGTTSSATEKLEVNGNIKISGTIISNGTVIKMPPVCTGENKALQWDGSNWNCIQMNSANNTTVNNNTTTRTEYVSTPAPVINASRICTGRLGTQSCSIIYPGDSHRFTWSTENTSKLSYQCTGPNNKYTSRGKIDLILQYQGPSESYETLLAQGWTVGIYACSMTAEGPGGVTNRDISFTIAPEFYFSRTCDGSPCTTIRPGNTTYGANWTSNNVSSVELSCDGKPYVGLPTQLTTNYSSYNEIVSQGWNPGFHTCTFRVTSSNGYAQDFDASFEILPR